MNISNNITLNRWLYNIIKTYFKNFSQLGKATVNIDYD